MTATIAAALVAAQADMPVIGKDSTNPAFRSRYASLDVIIETVRPVLAQHGLAVVQSATAAADGAAIVVTSTLIHTSGETLEATAFIPLAKRDPQGAGAAMTYGRRFSLSALLALATDEDDDGNTASRPPKAKTNAPPRGPVESAPARAPFAGAPEDRKIKGKRLGDMTKEELSRLRAWAEAKSKETTDDAYRPLIRDIAAVRANLSLGLTDDASVERMRADVEKPDNLPFD